MPTTSFVDGARDDLPDNVRFGQADASSRPYDGLLDLVYVLDPFITLAIRIRIWVLAGIARNLAPGGTG